MRDIDLNAFENILSGFLYHLNFTGRKQLLLVNSVRLVHYVSHASGNCGCKIILVHPS